MSKAEQVRCAGVSRQLVLLPKTRVAVARADHASRRAATASFEHIVSGSFEGLASIRSPESDHGVTHDFGARRAHVAVPNLGADAAGSVGVRAAPRQRQADRRAVHAAEEPRRHQGLSCGASRPAPIRANGAGPSGPIPANRGHGSLRSSLEDPITALVECMQWSVVQADDPPGAPSGSRFRSAVERPSAPAGSSDPPPPPPPTGSRDAREQGRRRNHADRPPP